MLDLREYKKNPNKLSDLLPWAALVAPGIVLNKDGSFQRTVAYRGPDLDSSTESELVAVSAQINNAFKRLGSGWAIFSESQRVLANRYPDSTFRDPIPFLIDQERRSYFQDQSHFESYYFLTLLYLPLSESKGKIAALFVENSEKTAIDYRVQLEGFRLETDRIIDLLHGTFPLVVPLDDQQTLTYLHSAISPKRHTVRVPEVPMYLDGVLPDTPLIGGLEPRLGRKTRLGCVSVLGYPGRCTPGILDGLNRLAIEYRWVTRFIPIDKTAALSELETYKKRWFSRRKKITTLLKEAITKTESIMSDSDAINKGLDADVALQELADDLVSYGYFTSTVVVMGKTAEELEEKTRRVEEVINGLGFTTILEAMNAVESWLGSLPGHTRANVRRPLLNTLNLAHLMPVSSVWAGPERNHHLDAPVLLHAITSGNTPFRFSTHIGDVGHTMIVGPTGSGKDVLMATMQAQFLRYRDSQIYIFDKGGSSRALTAGVGGDFYDLGSESESLSFQPLCRIDNEAERTWATEWILGYLRQENLSITPLIKAETYNALTCLASSPVEERTISGLVHLCQRQDIKQALRPITVDGPLKFFDATSDSLTYGRWQTFEMEKLMNMPSAIAPALEYLFHRLEERFTGVPTQLYLNEAWVFFCHPVFGPRIYEWLKVARKLNVSVIFATQGLKDIEESPIASTLIESCPTRVFLPNSRALEENAAQIYSRFGLNQRQLEILAMAQPKRQYYYQSVMGNRLFELGLGPLALAYCAAGNKEEQIKIQKTLAECGKDGFNAAWLTQKGLSWAVELLKCCNE